MGSIKSNKSVNSFNENVGEAMSNVVATSKIIDGSNNVENPTIENEDVSPLQRVGQFQPSKRPTQFSSKADGTLKRNSSIRRATSLANASPDGDVENAINPELLAQIIRENSMADKQEIMCKLAALDGKLDKVLAMMTTFQGSSGGVVQAAGGASTPVQPPVPSINVNHNGPTPTQPPKGRPIHPPPIPPSEPTPCALTHPDAVAKAQASRAPPAPPVGPGGPPPPPPPPPPSVSTTDKKSMTLAEQLQAAKLKKANASNDGPSEECQKNPPASSLTLDFASELQKKIRKRSTVNNPDQS